MTVRQSRYCCFR